MGPAGKLFYTVLLGRREKRYFRERTAGIYDGSLENATPPIYIAGYWQSERYFRDVEKHIREDFSFRLPLSDRNRGIIEEITGTESVGVHVRRGDYAEKPGAARTHGGVCGDEYYRKAVSLVAGKVKNPVFFFFSDAIDWVESNLRVRDPSRYVGGNAGDRDWEDMRLMSLCRHNIIANSSFSWWAAWLNSNPGKTVIAPSRWFSDKGRTDRDIVPSGWVRV